jgi:DNA-binding PadR family transcriptional regulator
MPVSDARRSAKLGVRTPPGGKTVKLPQITHLQFSVLAFLRSAEQPGKAVRRQLADLGLRRSGPAFYQLMSRLEDAGLVRGRYNQKVIEGQIIKERFYAITEDGIEAWRATRDFYVETIRAAERAPTESV